MKKFLMFFMAAVLIVSISACGAEQYEENSVPEQESSESVSDENLSESAAGSPHSCAFDLSYRDYFSKERKYEDLTAESSEAVRYIFEISDEGNLCRYLYKRTGRDESRIETVYSDGFVNDYTAVYEELIFAVDGKRIYRSDLRGDGAELICEIPDAAGDIRYLFANEALVWFKMDDAVYRLHRSSGTLEKIYADENMLFMRPLSNYSIEYTAYSQRYLDFLESGGDPENGWLGSETTTYIYNSHTGENYEAQFLEEEPYTIIYDIQ